MHSPRHQCSPVQSSSSSPVLTSFCICLLLRPSSPKFCVECLLNNGGQALCPVDATTTVVFRGHVNVLRCDVLSSSPHFQAIIYEPMVTKGIDFLCRKSFCRCKDTGRIVPSSFEFVSDKSFLSTSVKPKLICPLNQS
ncbi:hypothetical protein MTR_3g117370 [Medicago truncatula]|uniref:Uncharacterized protein n=1 Tax=Medicago truncatula TaxID=3880 RepID=G7J7S0_MEDTR|nr:hypothetical protein MTR_3g117370 [Medicago truncatula]